jgi:hypothetical protein
MSLFLPYVLHTVWCLSKSYAHTNNCKKQPVRKRKEKKEEIEKTKRKKQQHR